MVVVSNVTGTAALPCAGVVVMIVITVFAFVTMVVGILVAIGVAVSGFFEMIGSGSSSELRGAPSHLTRKWLTNVGQEVRTFGELLSSSSYQYSASKSALHLR